MLDAWIIEEIKRRQEKKEERESPFLELPIDYFEYEEYEEKVEEEPKRGVIEIQL